MTMELKALDLKGLYFPPGELIAERFKLSERIGEGTFGQVYRAEDTLIESEVAIKLFAREVLRTPLDEERFLKATRAARTLTQRNVVRLHDSGVHKGHPWVSMQHLEGLNLQKVLKMRQERGQRFELEELEPIVAQITLALQHVGRDYPHGNLKPENILFLPDLLKITDTYVLAALAPEVVAERAHQSPFMAPELRSAAGAPDARADVYSVGALLKEMVFGPDHAPGSYRGDSQLEAVDALIQRAMATVPDERYPSVEALGEDFATVVDTGQRLVSDGNGAAPTPMPPAPPMAPAAPSAELLEEETPLDIGEPPEDDIATVEVKRSGQKPELIDMLPTNEVDRATHAAPPVTSTSSGTASSGATGPSAPPPPSQVPARKERSPGVAGKVAATPASAARGAAQKKTGGKVPVAALVALIFIALIVALVAMQRDDKPAANQASISAAEAVSPGEPKPEELANASSVTPDSGASDEVAEAAQARREAMASLVASAGPQLYKAVDDASQAAATRGEELAEETRQAELVAAQQQAETSAPQPEQGGSSSTSPTGRASERTASGAASRPTEEAARPVARGTNCPSGMVLVRANAGNFCVDAYEYPGRGRTPKTRVTWFEARRLCAQDTKRLCTISEWRSTCGGSAYPYGNSFDADRCNTADEDGFERNVSAAGSFAQCRSRSGAFDMTGNVHEWVEEQRVAGGGFDSSEDVASCRYSSPKAPGSGASNIGFRCCANPS
ncbi:hypothetical protein DL240_05630 [Lujinxingia litoralis]|uniref:Protein kinase domain-containing protein n=1 Tax=Lujinxingia litoralis TaxID=2211119 RepID=A0A328C7V3_9DELT|nr:bifunctional serine/threonine-protein kinase/formylglycine-generating enzyme family protein [Lujinxingia litoralis]RAL23640.1 hypothetical protein DL240_05630 [Lujinxingia litoralis]